MPVSAVTPVILRGPCIVKNGSLTVYTQADVRCVPDVKSFNIQSDFGGAHLDPRYAGHFWRVTCTPVGEMENASLYWPHVPANIGASVFGGSTLVIHSKTEGKTVTFTSGAVSQMPPLILSSRKQPFGQMEFYALGAPTWATTAFADTSFGPSNIYTGLYSAALGARSSPYDAMGGREGFECKPMVALEEVTDDHGGVVDFRISDVWCDVTFAPNNLTRAEYEELLPLSGSNILTMGQSFTKLDEDLTITGDHCVFVLPKCGAVTSERGFGVKVDGNLNVTFSNRGVVSTGVVQPRWTITFS